MKRVELIIGSGTEQISLDLTANAITIALQYSIDDVRNIEKKNSNYSKNITLPGTKKNNDAFGNLFDVNQSFTQYNPNLKVDARIVVDSSPVLEGYLQLVGVDKKNDSDLQGNRVEYNVIVFDNSVDFFQSVGDKLLRDLDISSLNHTYDRTNIENAWNNHTFSDVYQYPLLDKNTQGYETIDFKPAFYHKGLLLKVAEDVGYKLEGSFIDGNTQYDNELIAWDGETPTLTDSQVLSRKYKSNIGVASDTIGTYTKDNFNSLGTLVTGNQIEQDVNYEDVIFDNTSTYVSDLTLSYWEASRTGRYDFSFNHRFKVTEENLDLVNPALCKANTTAPINNSSFKMLVRIDLWDSISNTIVGSSVANLGFFSSMSAGATNTTDVDTVVTIAGVQVIEGQKLYPTFTLASDKSFGWNASNGSSATDVELELTIYDTLNAGGSSSWSNTPSLAKNIVDGDIIELGLYLPKQIKQRDLFNDLVRRYNLYIRRHPIKKKTLILETRDDFYDTTTVLDWTQKKDYSNQDSIKFLAELQDKEIVFSYKADESSPYNKAYTKSTGDIYGQKKIEFENDFVKNTKKITSIFSTSPLPFKGLEGNDVVVPNIDSDDGKRVPSLIYWGGLKPSLTEFGVSSTFDITWGNTTLVTVSRSTYPYAGHYDDPYTPTLDIHFGQVTYEYYGILLNNLTNNNLFNTYWRNYIDQITNGKLVTSSFYLNETDINFIKDNLNARIFIKDSYHVVNKITDYKPSESGSTRVELLQIRQGTTFTPTSADPTTTFTTFNQLQIGLGNSTTSNTKPLVSNKNNVNTRKADVIGEDNYVGAGSSATINGNDNIVGTDSTGVNIQGNDNVVGSGVDNVTIVGDGVTVNTSNTSVINGVTFKDGIVTSTNQGSYLELEIGDWDMDATLSVNIAHDLSATEWKTLRNMTVTIRNDLDTVVYDFDSYPSCHISADSTNIVMTRLGSFFDSTDFDSTSYNRGWITFNYTPD